jgi:hypothetical protein
MTERPHGAVLPAAADRIDAPASARRSITVYDQAWSAVPSIPAVPTDRKFTAAKGQIRKFVDVRERDLLQLIEVPQVGVFNAFSLYRHAPGLLLVIRNRVQPKSSRRF